MAYREVEMVEVKEVLRLWLLGRNKTRIAAQVGVDRKTVRSYLEAAQSIGLKQQDGVAALNDEVFVKVIAALRPPTGRPRGSSWALCEAHQAKVQELIRSDVKLTKVRKLLAREGVTIPYATLHRFCVERLAFGQTAATIPVADGKAGEELQVDTGWVLPPRAWCRRSPAARAGLDFHAQRLALPLRLALRAGDYPERDRSL